MSLKTWWAAHAAQETTVKNFAIKYPMQIIIAVLLLCLFVSCHHNAHAQPPSGAVVPLEEVQYGYPRADNGLAFVIERRAGTTLLRDSLNNKVIGDVYVDPKGQSFIVRIGTTYVGIK